MDFLDGAKTILGAAVLIGGGAAGMYFGVIPPTEAIALIGSGITALGLGGKAEKQKAATIDSTKKIEAALRKLADAQIALALAAARNKETPNAKPAE